MSIYNIDSFFQPSSVAVIGASEKQGSIGHALIQNLVSGGYTGAIFPVNPKYESVRGMASYPSVKDIGQAPDLAVISTPIATIPPIIGECVQAGVRGAVIISAGGREVGEDGKKIEEEIKREAGRGGLRIIGPNCVGIVCTGTKLNATFAHQMALPGSLALISQSGALCSGILDLSLKERIGFSHFISIGSMLDVDFGDLIDYLGNDPDVSSIVLYIEGLNNFRKFLSASRAVSRVKPIVALKAGRSKAGARAAISHTGSLAGEDAVYDAAFKRAGILRVSTIEDLFDCAELMAKQPIPKGPRLVIVTNAGGPGVMAADALSAKGVEPTPLDPALLEKLNAVLPRYWSHGNPVDILGDATPDRYKEVVSILLESTEIDGLIVMYTPQAVSDPVSVAESIAGIVTGKTHPIFTVWLGGSEAEKGRGIFNASSIPTYETPERAVAAFMHMYSYSRNLEILQETPPKQSPILGFDQNKAKRIIDDGLGSGNGVLGEMESKKLLESYGIPVNRTEAAASADDAVRLAHEIGYPVAMKIRSKDITHKFDAHGVQLNLDDDKAVHEAFQRIVEEARQHSPSAEIKGITVQGMVRRADYELIVGSKKDPDFGPVILFGMGGVMTEILKDRAIGLPPLNRHLARRIMEETRIYNMLKGFRGRPSANLWLVEEILIRLSQLVTDFPQIVELDMNPLILWDDKACAVDARVVLEKTDISSPLHLSISPYPNQYEMAAVTSGGLKIFLRPIKPEDEPLLLEFLHSLSEKSRYYRFFSPIKTLPHRLLARFTQIDYDRDVALVAMDAEGERERIMAVCRLTRVPGTDKAEVAVTVGDPWQGRGVGAKMLERCIAIAKERGIGFLYGIVMAENTNMLGLARKLGFSVTRDQDGYDYEIKRDLRSLEFEEQRGVAAGV